ncbi:MAG TPA: type I restriction enzyme HsdR N-terminal domain-containing protein, partial [Pirellulales bacterium]|nr:type I restriction enzyme HsdR N-terminal domain-containing protein [Pirellulales bacterium]
MASIPKKVQERLVDGIKRKQPIVAERRAADVGEADTVLLVTEILADVFGYELKEITAEYKIKGNRCDLATKIDGKLQTLIEVKAIGHVLKDQDVEQAANYVANLKMRECKWALLTNGQHWRLYSVECTGKIVQNLVVDIDFLALQPKSDDDIALLFLLCKEGWAKSAVDEYQMQREPLDRYIIAATLLTDRALDGLKRELRRVSPDATIDIEDIKAVLIKDVIKRELLEDGKAHGNRILFLDEAKENAFQGARREARPVAFAAETVFQGGVRRQDGHCQ